MVHHHCYYWNDRESRSCVFQCWSRIHDASSSSTVAIVVSISSSMASSYSSLVLIDVIRSSEWSSTPQQGNTYQYEK